MRFQSLTNRPQDMLEEFLRLGFPGERRKRLGKCFQLAPGEMLRGAHGLDVRVRAIPLHQFSLLVVKRHSLEKKPAILSIKSPQPRLILAGARREDRFPILHSPVVGVDTACQLQPFASSWRMPVWSSQRLFK